MNQRQKGQQVLNSMADALTCAGYKNRTTSRAEFGKNADVVGMAFDRWGETAAWAERNNWENPLANKTEKRYGVEYEEVKAIALELMPRRHLVATGDRNGVTTVAPGTQIAKEFDESLEAAREYLADMDAASYRGVGW